MPRVTVDFSEVESFEPIPKGEYDVVISGAEYRVAQEEGKFDYINLELTVTEEGEYQNRKLWLILSFSPKSLFRMKDVFENLGIYEEGDELEIDYDDEAEPMVVTEPELVGIPAVAVVSLRPYQGKDQNQVDALIAQEGEATKAEPGTKAAAKKASGTAAKPRARRFQ